MEYDLEYETGIHFIEDPKQFPYLRESHVMCTARKGWKKTWGSGYRVVAIAELSEKVKTVQRRLPRRYWYFDDGDPYPGSDAPSEAVIPESISVGKPSVYGRK